MSSSAITKVIANAISKATLTANSLLYAVSAETPAALSVAASRIVGRKATGDIAALTGAEAGDIISPAWTTPAFSAGDFTADGSMTWTVAAGDIITYAYLESGRKMLFSFMLDTTTLGGTPNSALYIKIPNSKTSTKRILGTCSVYPAGSWQYGHCEVLAGGTKVGVYRDLAGTNWTVSGSDNVYIRGIIEFETNA